MIKKSKFNSVKTIVDGIKFDSKKEAARYGELKLLVRAGAIHGLELQPKYPLMVAPDKPVKSRTARYPSGRQVNYYADFRYYDREKNRTIVEDAKGMDTDSSRIRRAVVEAYYNIEIELV